MIFKYYRLHIESGNTEKLSQEFLSEKDFHAKINKWNIQGQSTWKYTY